MPTRRILRPWTQQPQVATRLRPALLGPDGLLEAVVAASPVGLVDGLPLQYSAPPLYYTPGVGPAGRYIGAGVTNTTTYVGCTSRTISASQSVTYVAQFTPNLAPTSLKSVTRSGTYQMPIGVGYAGSPRICTSFRLDGDSLQTYVATDYDAVVGQPYCAVAVFEFGRGISLYVNGEWIGDYSDTRALIVTNSNASWFSWAGVGFAATFLRALSRKEAVEISGNPWILFEPQQIYVPRSAGEAGYTHPTLSNARMIWTGLGAGKPAIDYTW